MVENHAKFSKRKCAGILIQEPGSPRVTQSPKCSQTPSIGFDVIFVLNAGRVHNQRWQSASRRVRPR